MRTSGFALLVLAVSACGGSGAVDPEPATPAAEPEPATPAAEPMPADATGEPDPLDELDLEDARAMAAATDSDADGHSNLDDNCPGEPNPDQADGDGDGRGDVCDECPDVEAIPQDPTGCITADQLPQE